MTTEGEKTKTKQGGREVSVIPLLDICKAETQPVLMFVSLMIFYYFDPAVNSHLNSLKCFHKLWENISLLTQIDSTGCEIQA